MKVIRGRFSDLSLKMRLEKKMESEKARKESRHKPTKQVSQSPLPQRRRILGLDSQKTKNLM